MDAETSAKLATWLVHSAARMAAISGVMLVAGVLLAMATDRPLLAPLGFGAGLALAGLMHGGSDARSAIGLAAPPR